MIPLPPELEELAGTEIVEVEAVLVRATLSVAVMLIEYVFDVLAEV